MTLEDFIKDMTNEKPNIKFSLYLKALWWDAKGQWGYAHELVDRNEDADSAHIHAYLHRVEGDQYNANYWYQKAGVKPHKGSLEDEWLSLFRKFNR